MPAERWGLWFVPYHVPAEITANDFEFGIEITDYVQEDNMEFNASNDLQVSPGVGGGRTIKDSLGYGVTLAPDEVDAFREYFENERDEQLGRWRWPEDTNYVVYHIGSDGPLVRVLNEGTGAVYVYDPLTVAETDTITVSRKAARAYFDAHPTPHPWHDAKVGEVWTVELDGQTSPAIVVSDGEQTWFQLGDVVGDPSRVTVGHRAVTNARRIWKRD